MKELQRTSRGVALKEARKALNPYLKSSESPIQWVSKHKALVALWIITRARRTLITDCRGEKGWEPVWVKLGLRLMERIILVLLNEGHPLFHFHMITSTTNKEKAWEMWVLCFPIVPPAVRHSECAQSWKGPSLLATGHYHCQHTGSA
jgi:hypothetical protein